MKKILVPMFCAVALCLFVSPAAADLPKDHAQYMKNEDYKEAFTQFTAVMKEAKDNFTPDEYKALEKEIGEQMAASVKEDMESGSSEAEAYETAFYMGNEQVGKELRWDWLRKNAEDAQGFYRLKSNALNGYMVLEKAEENGEYAVDIYVAMIKEPFNEGSFYGPGKLSGNKMIAPNDDDANAVIITLDGDVAKIATSKTFKESGALGANVTIEGEYLRERK